MSETSVPALEFGADMIKRWRLGALRASQAECGAHGPGGWSLSGGDPAALLVAFDRLGRRPGVSLRAFVNRSGGNALSRVVAVPDGVEVVDPGGSPIEPPAPAGALADPMDAVDGDGTAESYLQASIAQRELAEFCARGHGMGWQLHHVLGNDVWSDPPSDLVSPTNERPSGVAQMWSWTGTLPRTFAPSVITTARELVVTFYTYTAVDVEQVIRHSDVYQPDNYVAERQSELLGTGRAGYRL